MSARSTCCWHDWLSLFSGCGAFPLWFMLKAFNITWAAVGRPAGAAPVFKKGHQQGACGTRFPAHLVLFSFSSLCLKGTSAGSILSPMVCRARATTG